MAEYRLRLSLDTRYVVNLPVSLCASLASVLQRRDNAAGGIESILAKVALPLRVSGSGARGSEFLPD